MPSKQIKYHLLIKKLFVDTGCGDCWEMWKLFLYGLFFSRKQDPIQTPSQWITTSLFICCRKHGRTQTQHVEDVLPLHLWMLRGVQVLPGKKVLGGCCNMHAKPKTSRTSAWQTGHAALGDWGSLAKGQQRHRFVLDKTRLNLLLLLIWK